MSNWEVTSNNKVTNKLFICSVGEVKEVRSNDFLVNRPMARDDYVPFSAAHLTDDHIQLNVRDTEVDNQGWETPELAGS